MRAKALDIKNWAETNLSPLAWKRIMYKTLPTFDEFGFQLNQLEMPAPNIELEGKLLHELIQNVYQIYKVKIPPELLYS